MPTTPSSTTVMRDQDAVPAEAPLASKLAMIGQSHASAVTIDRLTPGRPTNRWALGAMLGDRALRGDVIRLAWPVVVEQLLATSVGLVDVAVIGRLGSASLAGSGLGLQIIMVAISALSAFGIGTTILVAQATGRRDPLGSATALRQGLTLGTALSVILTIVGLLVAAPLMAFLGGTGDVAAMGTIFLQVSLLGMVPLTLQFALGGAMRGAGNSRTPMVAGALVNVINIVGAYGLAFGELGMPNLGIAGPPVAANVSRVVGVIYLLAVLTLASGPAGLRIGRLAPAGASGWRPSAALTRQFVRLSLPSVIEQLSFSFLFLVMGRLLLTLGTTVFAAQRITFSAGGVTWLPAIGLATATTALVGQAIGAKDFDRVRAVTRFSQLLGVIWMVCIGVIFAFTARLVAGAFTTDDVIVEAAAGGLYAFVPALPLFAYNMITSGALRGTGDTTFPMINQVTTTWCVTMPCVWIFSTYLGWGLMGACLAFAVSSSINCAVLTYRFGREYWRARTTGPTIVPAVFTHAGE